MTQSQIANDLVGLYDLYKCKVSQVKYWLKYMIEDGTAVSVGAEHYGVSLAVFKYCLILAAAKVVK